MANRRIARPQSGWFGNDPGLAGLRENIADIDTALQTGERGIIRFAFDLRPISLCESVTWIGNPGLQLAVVGQQKQTFAVGIEPPGGIDPRYIDEIRKRQAARLWRELAQHVVRLVEQDLLEQSRGQSQTAESR